ncbi:MAG: bifunctional DNA primase/polymerase [Opitutaceae bacterium]
MTGNPYMDAALALARQGLPVFPCAPGAKNPLTAHGFKDASVDEDVIKSWWKTNPTANIGLPTGELTDLVVVDIDQKNGNNGGWNLYQIGEKYGGLPETREIKTPSGGRHLYFNYPGTKVGSRTNCPCDGVDIRGDGGYIITPPSRCRDSDYIITRDIVAVDLPDWFVNLVADEPRMQAVASRSKYIAKSPDDRQETANRIEAALKLVPPDDRDTWIKMGMAIHSFDPEGLGFGLWDGWSKGCPEKYNSDEMDRIWKSFSEDRSPSLGLGSLFAKAKANGWIPVPRKTNVESDDESLEESQSKDTDDWPAPLSDDAYIGLAGRIARTFEPHTEAALEALLLQFLVSFGNMIGRGPHFKVGADRHGSNEFLVLVGPSGTGRKGSSLGYVRALMKAVAPIWVDERIMEGLSSGEGLTYAIRDAEYGLKDGQEVMIDKGVMDKRLLVIEPEFASVLKAIERAGNTLSAVVRKLWDQGSVRSMTKNSPLKATDAHVSIIGHITQDEVVESMKRTELANGFANRYIFACVRRTKFLPFPGTPSAEVFEGIVTDLKSVVAFAKTLDAIGFEDDARVLWIQRYRALSAGKPGISGSVLGRAEPHTLRLALIFAILDKAKLIGTRHLEAALSIWDYIERSVLFIFGQSTGNRTADTIYEELLRIRPSGMTRTEISKLLQGHSPAHETKRALTLLESCGRIYVIADKGESRTIQRWFASATQ